MKPRFQLAPLRRLLGQFPAVALLGPRQVGKTTLARALAETAPASVYLDLESPADAAKLVEPEAYLAGHDDKLVVLDEVQRAPQLFAALRSVIDRRRRGGQRAGQFLLLVSASGGLLQQSSESLAGRLAYCELTPFLLPEAAADGARAAEQLWLRGGFPESYLAPDDAASLRWRSQFIKTYLERDIPQLGPRIPAETLRRFWTMLAHEQGQTINAAKLAAALAVSGQTIARYLDLMCDLMLARRLAPWAGHPGKRLVRSPKVYVRDSGLVHALLGIASLEGLLGHPVAGSSWEGLAIESLIGVAPEGTHAYFYRSAAGAEIDLVLALPGGERWAIEIKRSLSPTASKGLHLGADDVGATRVVIAYPGGEAFALPRGVRAEPLAQLVRTLALRR